MEDQKSITEVNITNLRIRSRSLMKNILLLRSKWDLEARNLGVCTEESNELAGVYRFAWQKLETESGFISGFLLDKETIENRV